MEKVTKKIKKVVEMKFHPKDYYDKVEENTMEEPKRKLSVGYKQIGMKDKGGKKVPNCVKEEVELYYEENGKGYGYTFEFITDKSLL